MRIKTSLVVFAFWGLFTSTLPGQNREMPEFFGYYLVSGSQVQEMKSVKVAHRGAENKGYPTQDFVFGVENVKGLDIADSKAYLLVFQENIDIKEIRLNRLKFNGTLQLFAAQLIGDSLRLPTRVNLWSKGENISFKTAPVPGRTGMYKIVPDSELLPGAYALTNGPLGIYRLQNPFADYNANEMLDNTFCCVFTVNFSQYQDQSPDESREEGGKNAIAELSNIEKAQRSGWNYIMNEQYDSAELEFRRSTAMNGFMSYEYASSKSIFGLGLALAYQHQFDEAIAEFEKAIKIRDDFPDPYYSLASIHSLRMNKDKAIVYLETAIHYGFKDFSFLNSDTDFDNIREDPRFIALISRRYQ